MSLVAIENIIKKTVNNIMKMLKYTLYNQSTICCPSCTLEYSNAVSYKQHFTPY